MTEVQDISDPTDPERVEAVGSAPLVSRQMQAGWGGIPLDPTSVLFVSLFLVLFAFFAFLNANASERPDEASAVMRSLHEVFSSGSQGRSNENQPANGAVDATQLSKARHEFDTDFPELQTVGPASGDQFEASIPLKTFFIKDTSRIAPSRELFLKTLATLASQSEEEPLGIMIEFSGSNRDFGEHRRVAALAATLGKYGVPSRLLSVGSMNVSAGQIRLVVRRG